MSNYSTTVSCKKCGGSAILRVTCVVPNSTGGTTASCNKCYMLSQYSYVLTEGVFTYLQ